LSVAAVLGPRDAAGAGAGAFVLGDVTALHAVAARSIVQGTRSLALRIGTLDGWGDAHREGQEAYQQG
jgi:hypothetical protein